MGRETTDRDKKSVDPIELPIAEAVSDDPARLFAVYQATRDPGLAARIHSLTEVRLRLYAATFLRDPNDVDDAVQEAFLVAFEHPESWQSDRPFLPWLGGILRNRVSNRRRSERRRRAMESAPRDPLAGPTDPVERLGAAEVFRVVEQGIAGLPATYRPVVATRVLDGASSAEIARSLNRAENTVRVQLRRGLRMLRDALPVGVGAALVVALTPSEATCGSAAATTGGSTPLPPRHLVGWRPTARGALLATVVLLPLVVWAALPGESATPISDDANRIVALAPPEPSRSADRNAPSLSPSERVTVSVPSRAALTIELLLDGRPAVGAPVSIERIDDLDLFVSSVADANGPRRAFEVPGATPGPRIRARTNNDGTARFEPAAGRYVVRVPGNGTILELGSNDARQVRADLTSGATAIRCSVVDESGAPCVAEIWASDGAAASPMIYLDRTDATGHFAGVLAKGARVRAQLDGRASATISAVEGQHDRVLQLAPAGRVEGRIRGPDGAALGAAVVELLESQNPIRVRADSHGRFLIPAVLPGTWTLLTRGGGAGNAFGRTVVTVRTAATETIELDAQATATVVGRVTDPLARPIPHTRVRVGWSPLRLDAASAVTDATGRFELVGVPPGSIPIEAGLAHDGFASGTISTTPGEHLVWNASLSPDDLRVAGVVETAAGAPDLVIGFDSDDHFRPASGAIENGRFSVQLPPSAARRLLTARIYRADTIDALGLRNSFPIAVRNDIEPGELDISWRLDADLHPRGELRAHIVAPTGENPGRVRLMNLDMPHWIEIGELALSRRHLDVHVHALPAGRYALMLDGDRDRVEFQLGAGESLDLGDVLMPRSAGPDRASVGVQLVFDHPDDTAVMERLDVEVKDLDGHVLARAGAPGHAGAWRVRVSLPPGSATVVARSLSGLAADVEIQVPDDGEPQIEIPLRRAQTGR